MKLIKRNGKNGTESMYGRKLTINTDVEANTASTVFPYELKVKRVKRAELIRRQNPNVDVIQIEYDENGIITRYEKELEFLRNEEESERSNEIIKTLENVLNKREVEVVTARSLATEISKILKYDTRFAYKTFYNDNRKNGEMSVYIYALLAIIVATVSSINDVDFKSDVSIMVDRFQNSLGVCFRIRTGRENIKNAKNNKKFELKLGYISAICFDRSIESKIFEIGEEIIFDYKLERAPLPTYRFFAKEEDKMRMFNELLNTFNPPSTYEPDDSEIDYKNYTL